MQFFKKFLFKLLRFAGIIAIVYASLVFYLLLSERRLAFPRAESDTVAEKLLEKNAVICHADDALLQGWILNDSLPETVLYFADGGEDAATFLSHAKKLNGFRFVAFNYRGSAGSEGRPAEKHYADDISAMIGCANAANPIFIGHGTGSIAAYNAFADRLGKAAILVDPAESFNATLSSRYRIFFPAFLGRTKARMNFHTDIPEKATVITDDPRRQETIKNLLAKEPDNFRVVPREGASLLEILQREISAIHP